jgi:hypothetical protein
MSYQSTAVPKPTRGAKMLYLIKRRPTTSREELVAHWFGNHMGSVVKAQHDRAALGKSHAWRYIATLFDADRQGNHPWDGVAQLWFEKALPKPDVPIGTTPTDTFQQKVEPYVPWATREYVVMEGSESLKVEPLTLNDPFPCTRSGFFKVTFLVRAKAGTDFDAFYAHWLQTHVPNVRSTMEKAGGFRYVVGQSIDPQQEPYAGLAELYFDDKAGWARYGELVQPDGMEKWVEREGTLVLHAGTEMIGVP